MESRNVCSQDEPYISHHFLLLSRHVYLFVFVFGGLCTVSGGVYACANECGYGWSASNQPTERATICFHTKVLKSNNIPYTFDLYCVVHEVSSFVLELFNGMYHIQKE